jgi:ubiquitin-protein ligase
VEGFKVELADESNLFEWIVYITGPPGTEFDGGIFKAVMTFPDEYLFNCVHNVFCTLSL